MPRKGNKSRAAKHREQIKKDCVDLNGLQELSSVFENSHSLQGDESISDIKVVSGTFHQGDTRFRYPGIQCTYISFFALISMKLKDPMVWIGNDIDLCIIKGNAGFIEHCFKQKWKPKMLLVNELPETIKVNGVSFECRQSDIDVAIGVLAQPTTGSLIGISLTIDDAISKCFDISDSCLLVCGGQTFALAKLKNSFFIFDPHSRGIDGMQHHSGNAVLVTFSDIQSLIGFTKRLLMNSLKLKPSEQFELVPMFISEQHGSKR